MGLESTTSQKILYLFKDLFSENFIFTNDNQEMK